MNSPVSPFLAGLRSVTTSVMNNPAKLKHVFERNAKALSLKPAIGQNTGVTRVRLKGGLSCEIEDGPWKLTVGMPESSGGANSGPDPGPLGRGALGSCLAIGYAMWAARLDVALSEIEVEVQADYDARGYYGVAEVPPGYLDIRYKVSVKSDAPEEDVIRVLDQADAHSPWRDIFQRNQRLARELEIRR